MESNEVYCLKNGLYYLQVEEKQMVLSLAAGLNDNTMIAARKFICKETRDQDCLSMLTVVELHVQ